MDSNSATPIPGVPVLGDGAALVSNVFDQATANLIARVNAVSLTAEDLMLAAAEVQKLPLQTCNREARTRCLALMFEGRRGKAFVVNARLEAMAVLRRAGKIPSNWVGPNMVRDLVFLAAATEPLLFSANNESFFDPESFVASLLASAEVDGHA